MAEPATSNDARWMRRAVELGWSSKPSPGPRVGAVVVREDRVVAEGTQLAVDHVHAEIAALAAAGHAARGATMYTTLEPSSVEAIVAAGVLRVVIGGQRSRKSIDRLRATGIEVSDGVELAACDALVRAWRKHVATSLPYVVLKVGMSLDGRIATRLRESRWITGERSRRDAHLLRARADAILVGIGTVLADDPLLTPRDVSVPGHLPVRVVLDTHLRTPPTSELARTANDAPVWILHAPGAPVTRRDALRATGIETFELPLHDDHLSIDHALRLLGQRGIVEVLCEGGGAVHGTLLDTNAADAVVCYIAPVLIGGRDAFPAFGGLGAGSLSEARKLRDVVVERIGDDLRLSAEIEHVHGNHYADR